MKIFSLRRVLSGRVGVAALVTLLVGAALPSAYAQSEMGSSNPPALENDVLPNFPNYSTKWQRSAPVVSAVSPAHLTFTVTFNDPSHTYAAYYPSITAALNAAGAEWAKYLVGTASFNVVIGFQNIPTANGSSVTSNFVRNNGTRDIFEQGATAELRTGVDPNGAGNDIQMNIGTNYLPTLWFDPQPTLRTAPIPANKIDAISVLTHELGHAFVFSGWINGTTGQLPPTYMSTFDEKTHWDGTNSFFVGPYAEGVYGGQIPITFGNPFHLGNNSPRPGANLFPDLMNGVVYNYQTRYRVSLLDFEIARDCGVPLVDLANLVLRNTATRQTATWLMNDRTRAFTLTQPTLPAGWTVIDSQQFGGGGAATAPDFLLYNATTRASAVWYLNGSVRVGVATGPTIPTGWTLPLAEDFNADGRPDYLLYYPATRRTAIWYLNSALVHTSSVYGPTLPAGWSIVGARDFNRDSHPDLVLYNAATRQTAFWYLNGAQFLSSANGPTLPAGWAIAGVDDYNHDGKPDLLLTNASTRQTAIWHLNNNTLLSSTSAPTLPAGWTVGGPR